MPKVSVLMPVYNTKEEYLREAIESILNQTFTDFEFIILNDGSTDENVEKVIKSYDDERIKYFHKENTGIADTLNFGMAKAQGEYIARMDSDDISLPERFIKQIEFLDTNKNISILGCNFEIFPEIKIVQHPQNIKYLDLLKGCQIGHPTIMFRRSDFEKYNLAYNPKYKCEDYELWSRAIYYLRFANLDEVLLRYRWHETNLSKPSEVFQASVTKVHQSMLDFLTDDKELQQKIMNLVCLPQTPPNPQNLKYTFWQRIFSLRNHNRYKHLCILGIKIKFKRKFNYHVVRLMGGLGNQMFQYAFGLTLKAKTGKKVFFDTSWFKEVLKLADEKKEFVNGVAVRKYELDIFNKDVPVATLKQLSHCENLPEEKNAFVFDENLFKQSGATYFSGYFQNEKYFKCLKKKIKKEFTFPQIEESDIFNQNWLRKINECENSVFIHLRRGDYLNLDGWALTTEYYKKAIQYIKEHVKNPIFFVFGQNCEDYIKNELLSHPELVSESLKFEIIGEKNSQNKEDWKDIALMMHCKHAIIANSTFSWWAAWLGKTNENGIVVAPTPFINGQDEIICDNWVKIERE